MSDGYWPDASCHYIDCWNKDCQVNTVLSKERMKREAREMEKWEVERS